MKCGKDKAEFLIRGEIYDVLFKAVQILSLGFVGLAMEMRDIL